MPFSHILFALLLAISTTVAHGGEPLKIGSKAPPIEIEHWISDRQPITKFKPGKVYVIEFWATWCGPCVASIPHLRELQLRHGDAVSVVSISDEPLDTILDFLEREHGDKTFADITNAYWLATDPDGSVKQDYMRAAGQNGIPCAFIVGKTGEIEWIGHPMRIDDPVAEILAGTWDRGAYERDMEERRAFHAKTNQAMQQARTQGAAVNIRQLAIGDQITTRVTGRAEGAVWGDALYTTDSDLATAAVHAGLVRPGESRWVKVWVVPSPSRFSAALANGVQTRQWGRYQSAFFLQPVEPPHWVTSDDGRAGESDSVRRKTPHKKEFAGLPKQLELSNEWYRRELDEIGADPGPVAPTNKPVGEDDALTVGQVLLVQYGTTWWGARVIHLFPDGRVWIRYLGWSPVFDEAVSRNRLQFDDAAATKAKQTSRRR